MKMFCYKISKYNPNNYNHGVYLLDEWTDFSDIGKIFNNNVFTMDEYLRVEQNYILFVMKIISEIHLRFFIIMDLKKNDIVPWKNKQEISVVQLKYLIQDCLRNKCWCRIQSENFCLCFGFDFYMHMCCGICYRYVEKHCKEFSLYINEMHNQSDSSVSCD